MEYPFSDVESKWQAFWNRNHTFRSITGSAKPKYYVLDMFPYPSGAGLHVGHPLGYIASDIVARYKRLKGFEVLHPMGYDSFGLPAEQYAIQTGQHPAITTEHNIARYRQQLDRLGFSFDWEREVRTSDPAYYRWTQWIFLQLYGSWYNDATQKAEDISTLVHHLQTHGTHGLQAVQSESMQLSASEWNGMSDAEQQRVLLNYRLAFLNEAVVNWCPALGTVLANEEVKDGLSERGGHTVERKKMLQWSMRITAYADRLLEGLDRIEWSESIKEAQRNWIGRSRGSTFRFALLNFAGAPDGRFVEVFTTRPDTVFGVRFITLAPEHEWALEMATPDRRDEVERYVQYATNRSERERQADVKKVTGVFTGSFVGHPFSGEPVPIWLGEYVLAGYGTGAVMGVPGHDSRDHAFARTFGLPIVEVISGGNVEEEAWEAKAGTLVNSDFLNGLSVEEAIVAAIAAIEAEGLGKGTTQYRLRDATFSRQRYWGEPIPVYFKDGVPMPMPPDHLPLQLPSVDKYLPTESGEPPLARAEGWAYRPANDHHAFPMEFSTMPGWAGSSWYFLRYMDPHNTNAFAGPDALAYWNQVDLYIGGNEHATGHLLYSRFWTKFLFDRGFLTFDEPFKKLINQGMIQGTSAFVYRVQGSHTFVSKGHKENFITTALHVDVNLVQNNVLDIEGFKAWREEFRNSEFLLEEDKYICGSEVEKMSKSKWNVVNPDDVVAQYGADCLRLYEMFLGPLELSKPWNTNGITGVSGFIRKVWRLFHNQGAWAVNDEAPVRAEWKILHKTIKKIEEDMERFSFNTSVSTFMICVNELSDLGCRKRAILEPLALILAPYAPHLAEELWLQLGHEGGIATASFPAWNEEYLTEDSFVYPVSVNGKTRFKAELSLSLSAAEVEAAVLAHPDMPRFLEGKQVKKVVVVPGKIANVVAV